MNYLGDQFARFGDRTLDGAGVHETAAKKGLIKQTRDGVANFVRVTIGGAIAQTLFTPSVWTDVHANLASRFNDAFASGVPPMVGGALAGYAILVAEDIRGARRTSAKNERLRQLGIEPEADPLEEIKKVKDNAATLDDLASLAAEVRSGIANMKLGVHQANARADAAVHRALVAEQRTAAVEAVCEQLTSRLARAESVINNLHFGLRDAHDRQDHLDRVLATNQETLSRHGQDLAEHDHILNDHATRLDEDVQLLRARRRPAVPDTRAGPAARPTPPPTPAPPQPPSGSGPAPGWGPAQGGVHGPLPPPTHNSRSPAPLPDQSHSRTPQRRQGPRRT
ncbi:hypothetical protein [Fodinicola acaciae]|uniref:hypothetical protein n=1 Tax=Fodinicola acaciae TaxID=2681555 RepID=UPI0013D44094|nr:hypothetical protein [Fodinicola acaciae]